jgi:hypothetical protein
MWSWLVCLLVMIKNDKIKMTGWLAGLLSFAGTEWWYCLHTASTSTNYYCSTIEYGEDYDYEGERLGRDLVL